MLRDIAAAVGAAQVMGIYHIRYEVAGKMPTTCQSGLAPGSHMMDTRRGIKKVRVREIQTAQQP